MLELQRTSTLKGVLKRLPLVISLTVALGVLLVFGASSSGLVSRSAAVGCTTNTDPILQLKDCVQHVVVLMQENRSFDHYYGRLGVYDPTLQAQLLDAPVDYNTVNVNPSGGPPIHAYQTTLLCDSSDVNHGWNGTHYEWNGFSDPANATMDHFTSENSNIPYNAATAPNGNRSGGNMDPHDVNGRRGIGYYTEEKLPFYYKLYSTFATSDRYFQSALTQTFPNRFYLLAGTSYVDTRGPANQYAESGNRIIGTDPDLIPLMDMAGKSIFELLDEHVPPITWKVYFSEAVLTFPNEFAYVQNHPEHVVPIANYTADAAAGTLPQVAFVDPILIGGARNVQNDEHAANNVQLGQQFVSDRVNELFGSPNWSSTALFLTYDEHGGYFDRVPPPAAVPPDEHIVPPNFLEPHFDRYGIRVPVVAVSPFAKKHHVSHPGWTSPTSGGVSYDHTSILRFIETRFDLPNLTQRDLNADPMLDFFDFADPDFVDPPDTSGSYPLPASDPRLPPAPAADLTTPECQGGPDGEGTIDTDGDGNGDPFDNCPALSNSPWADWDGDGVGAEQDGVGPSCDNCPNVPNGTAETDIAGVGNQTNSDSDAFGDACDNCPATPNADQADGDGDGAGDACDNCPVPSADQNDEDNDGLGDACDPDIDVRVSKFSTGGRDLGLGSDGEIMRQVLARCRNNSTHTDIIRCTVQIVGLPGGCTAQNLETSAFAGAPDNLLVDDTSSYSPGLEKKFDFKMKIVCSPIPAATGIALIARADHRGDDGLGPDNDDPAPANNRVTRLHVLKP